MYLPICQTNLVIALYTLSILFCKFINTTAYPLGRYKPSPPSTKELHGLGNGARKRVSNKRKIQQLEEEQASQVGNSKCLRLLDAYS